MTRAALAAVLLLAACEKKIDVGDIEAQLEADRNARSVDCPGDMKPEKGAVFECKVELDGGTRPYVLLLSVVDIQGNQVQFATTWKEPLMPRTELVESLASQFSTVDCGTEPMIVRPPDGVVWCRSGARKLKVTLSEGLDITGAEIE